MRLLSFFGILAGICFSASAFAQMSEIRIPVLTIETVNHEMPTRTVVQAPEGCVGTSITDNNYVPGRMTVSLLGQTVYDTKEYEKNVSGMRIKVRGNSTGASLDQLPYKIKLSKKYDLLGREDEGFRHKEWLLLSMYTWNKTFTSRECNILNIAGLIISKILHKEWTPEYGFANVVLNGEYQGMYYLMESVSKGDKRVQLDKTGFLVEHDTFWWNEDAYFKTDYQVYSCGYTYKYPDSDDVTEEIQANIRAYINTAEHAIYEGGDVSQYIDLESFAKWVLIHDILGGDDSAGENRFLCRKDDSSLLCTGPTWDYDSSFRSDSWSAIHSSSWFYYPELFKRDDFVKTYTNLWKSIRPTILNDIQSEFDKVWEKYDDVFDKSMAIHRTKYPYEGRQKLRLQIDEVIDKLHKRVALLDDLMKQYDKTTTGVDDMAFKAGEAKTYIDLQGRKVNGQQRLGKGIYINNGKKCLMN